MLKAMKEKFNQKRNVWAQETAQRIEEYAEQQRLASLRYMKKQEEINQLLHQEIEKYLYTIHPSFLLNPDVVRALHNRLIARSQGRFSVSLHVTSEMRLALDFYNTDLSVFIRLLEKKGFQLKGNEERFLTALLNKLSENNYRMYIERYGDFVQSHHTLQDAMYQYLERVEDYNKIDSGRLDFLHKYLVNKGLLSSDFSRKKMKRLVKSFDKMYADEYKISKLEKRMQEIG
ncbi:hypothetical protein SAMN05192534_101448 [Alteribacillus persepolensis]|uniref:Uncharacterized protein n=1 Tax=Alteribacillus persepolensis TaxID=568899 RepID=A0A1G7Z933_9BACI|nr:hypothetical protein [Alteribacillus persepolensis]SDH05107.1 hypothetical protein SAMN05192534_101448 [Alteribacillus persepolensis]